MFWGLSNVDVCQGKEGMKWIEAHIKTISIFNNIHNLKFEYVEASGTQRSFLGQCPGVASVVSLVLGIKPRAPTLISMCSSSLSYFTSLPVFYSLVLKQLYILVSITYKISFRSNTYLSYLPSWNWFIPLLELDDKFPLELFLFFIHFLWMKFPTPRSPVSNSVTLTNSIMVLENEDRILTSS